MELKYLDRQVNVSTYIVLGLLCLLPIGYAIWFGAVHELGISASTGDWSDFATFYGGVASPLIAFSAFYWLARSVRIQKSELEATRSALEEQGKTLARQRFDSTFFSLVAQHNLVLEQLKKEPPPVANSNLLLAAYTVSSIDEIYSAVMRFNSIHEARAALHLKNHLCGHYFRLLYQILKYIATSCPDSIVGHHFRSEDLRDCRVTKQEKFYSNIVRSFLDYRVTQLLAVNCFTDDPGDPYYKYKLLIDRYAFLEHMPFDGEVGLNQTLLMAATAYDRQAFDDSQFFDSEVEGAVEQVRLLLRSKERSSGQN